MKIFYQNVASIFIFLSAGLSVVPGQHEESMSSLLDKMQVLSDDSRIIFLDENGDSSLNLEMEVVKEEERNFKEEEMAYKEELAEFSNNKSRHEDEVREFQKEKLKLINKMKEYEEAQRQNDERFKSQADELAAEENSLKKLKQKLEQEEAELEELVIQEKEAQKGLSDRNEKLSKREEELNKKLNELENQKKVEGCADAKGAEEEEKRLQDIHGKCTDIPEEFRKHVKEYKVGNSKLCYTLFEENDYDHEEMDIDIRMN